MIKELIYCAALIIAAASGDTFGKDAIVVIGQSNATGIVAYGGLASKLGVDVVDCTHRGMPIKSFIPSYDSMSFYGDCLKKAQPYNVKAIVFWHGESDTTIELVTQWTYKAMHVIRSLRQDLGDLKMPVVLVVLNNQPSNIAHPRWQTMRAYQKRFTATNLHKVDSDKYLFKNENIAGRMGERLHLTIESYGQISSEIALTLKDGGL